MAEAIELIDSAALSALSAVDAPRPTVYDWAPRSHLYEAAKDTIDMLISLVVIVGLLPVWLIIAAAVAATSRGPILHRGTVVGRGGRSFTWFKFRTMYVMDDSIHRTWIREYVLDDRPYRDNVYKVTPDPRVTPIGAWLRRFSLDEVPQFINVLKGEMSIVGPRPPLDYEFDLYDDERRRRLAVRPGITGLNQVVGRGRTSFSQMLANDLQYIERRSVWLDLSIMVRTAKVMVTGEGAA